jgi:Mn2+/Fe2+ NRAMP family transporter
VGRRWGFSQKFDHAPVFYGLVVLGTVGGTVLTLVHVNPIHLLVIVALINGIAATPFLVLVMLISNDRSIMGRFRNGLVLNVLGWSTAGLMAAAAIALLVVGSG